MSVASRLRSHVCGLWWEPEFVKLWAGQTISMVGSEVTVLALPLTAVLVLRATPIQMGILGAASTVPFLLFGLMAGVWIDRRRRRPVLIWSDLGRALLLAAVPAVLALGLLRIEVLYVVAFASGLLTLLFDVAYQAFLPVLVPPARLVDGNTRLETSRASAQVVGAMPVGMLVGGPWRRHRAAADPVRGRGRGAAGRRDRAAVPAAIEFMTWPVLHA